MSHWAETYVGRPYSQAEDCAILVKEVIRERFGKYVPIPSEYAWTNTSTDEVRDLAKDIAEAVDEPEEGDAVLMRVMGDGRVQASHIGIYVVISGRPWVLHTTILLNSHLTPVSELLSEQLEVVGYYRFLIGSDGHGD